MRLPMLSFGIGLCSFVLFSDNVSRNSCIANVACGNLYMSRTVGRTCPVAKTLERKRRFGKATRPGKACQFLLY